MNVVFGNIPVLFGWQHLLSLFLIIIFNIFFFRYIKKLSEDKLIDLLHILGIIMLIAEVFKQWFCFNYVFDRQVNLWFFPWQLCSMAMYCSFVIKYIRNIKYQNAFLIFLATYSFLSAVVALILPLDMLRPQIPLFIHGFVYHGLIISESIIAYLILSKRKQLKFRYTFILFLIMSLIAEIINVISHLLLNNIHIEPDMFYITLSYPTTQPLFHEIAISLGIIPEIIIYLLTISLFSYLLFLIMKRSFN